MNINLILVTEDNRADFAQVLPEAFAEGNMRVALGAYDDEGMVLGAASAVFLGDAYALDWLYVEEDYRRQGIGTALCRTLFDTMFAGGRYPVTAHYVYAPGFSALFDFFLSMEGADSEYVYDRYLLTPEDMQKALESNTRRSRQHGKVELFFDRDEDTQKEILIELSEEGGYDVEDYERWKSLCVPELCRCYMDGKRVKNAIFFQENADGNLELSFLYSKSVIGLHAQILEALHDVLAFFPESYVTFDALVPQTTRIAESLFPDAIKEPVYEAEW